MRSSSSELLLDQQEELRKRKLKELAAASKKTVAKHQVQSCRQRARFYVTTMLAVFSMSAGSSLLFLVPLYVDPAISTLVANFVPEPVICTTTRRDDLTGLMNCTWSSCREGCTSDMYQCTHIYVRYNASTPFPIEEDDANVTVALEGTTTAQTTQATTSSSKRKQLLQATAAASTQPTASVEPAFIGTTVVDEAVLLVNIKGCGYPPDVRCNNFTSMYGNVGTEFPCYHSRENRTVVLTHYDKDEQVAIIIHYFAVPFVITIATSAALCVMHCDCRCHHHATARHKRPDVRRVPRMQELR